MIDEGLEAQEEEQTPEVCLLLLPPGPGGRANTRDVVSGPWGMTGSCYWGRLQHDSSQSDLHCTVAFVSSSIGE